MTTYAELENSAYGGQPVELFRFVHGANVWTYNSGDALLVHNGETYTPLASGRDGDMTVSSEPNKTDITVVLPIGNAVSQLFLAGAPEQVVSLTVFRYLYGADTPEIYWKGRVVSASWEEGQANLSCESIFTSIKRTGLRARYQRGCRHALYNHGCGLNMAAFGVAGTVAAIGVSLKTVSVSAAASRDAGYFSAGMIRARGVLRFVLLHSAANLTIVSPIPGLAVGDAVTLYPGCDHGRITCRDKFNNILNYGGFPWIPTDNPFSGSIV